MTRNGRKYYPKIKGARNRNTLKNAMYRINPLCTEDTFLT